MELVPFLRRVEPYEGESLLGIMERAAVKNYWPDFKWADKLLPSRKDRRPAGQPNITYYFEEISALSELLLLPPERLYQGTVHGFAARLQSRDHLLRSGGLFFLHKNDVHRFALRRTTKYCPVCLSDGLYHRMRWDLLPVTTCPTHSILLLDRCPSCHGGVNHMQIYRERHMCGHDLRADAGCPPPGGEEAYDSQATVLALLGGGSILPSGHYQGPAFRLPSAHFFTILDILERIILRAHNKLKAFKVEDLEPPRTLSKHVWRQKLGNRDHHVLLMAALRVLTGWPQNFFKFLDECRMKGNDQSPGGSSDRCGLGQELAALRQSGLSFVSEGISEYVGARSGAVRPRRIRRSEELLKLGVRRAARGREERTEEAAS